MKFVKDNTGTVQIPNAALTLSGLDDSPRFGLYTLDGVAILVREKMTAAELVAAMESLNLLYEQLYGYLKKACGTCEECEEECPFRDHEEIRVPAELLRQADIPESAKLHAVADEEGIVMVMEADYEHDLSDVPAHLRRRLASEGLCLGELNDALTEEEIVYER